MSDVKPALTAEEWADFESYGVELSEGSDGVLVQSVSSRGRLDIEPAEGTIATVDNEDGSRHALAALCLHGQPFGFTREDVELLRAVADAIQYDPTEDRVLRSLAKRIEALLPPETP